MIAPAYAGKMHGVTRESLCCLTWLSGRLPHDLPYAGSVDCGRSLYYVAISLLLPGAALRAPSLP